MARSLAIAPGAGRLVLGTEWWLRAYGPDPEAGWDAPEPLWQQPVPGVVWALNISGDGRYAIAGYGDGTLRWHRMSDGAEVLALYVQPGAAAETGGGAEDRWVLWTPDGHYQASAGAEDLIGWHVNRGPGEAADFFPADRFRERFYRPDVIARVLETGDPAEALRLADAAADRPPDTRPIAQLLPPVVRVLAPVYGSPRDDDELTLHYDARSDVGPIDRVEARIDGRPAEVLREQVLSEQDGGRRRIGELRLRLPAEHATVGLLAYNANGASVAAEHHSVWAGTATSHLPDLYLLAVGVGDHPSPAARLDFADDDARDLASA
jgi:hypothetical protein